MKKRFLAGLFAGILAVSAFVPAMAVSFSDVTSAYDWASEAIYELADQGIIQGYPEGTFMPGNNITKEEAVTLFARAMGSSSENNEVIMAVAFDKAESALAKYDSYAVNQAAYLMYKNVLSSDDLATYLSSANKSKTLKRYEAATLIAKCLGGDVWLKTNPDVTLSFEDSETVPSSAVGYVYYATELGIIKGMDGNTFQPSGDVTRAQIATMIKRILDLMKFEYVNATISEVNTDLNILSLNYEDGESDSYTISKSVAVLLDGAKAQLATLDEGMEVVVTFSDGGLYSVDAVSIASEENITGVYRGSSTTGKVTQVRISPIGETDATTYELADNVVIKFNGAAGSLTDFSTGNQVDATVKLGKIVLLSAKPKSEEIVGAVLKSIDVSDEVYLVVTTEDNEDINCPVSSKAKVKKNGSNAKMSDLNIGDLVNLTLEYGKVNIIDATGISKTLTGTIEEIKISSTASSLKVKSGSSVKEFAIARDAQMTLDGQEATIYDLRLGHSLTLKTNSSTITSVEAMSTSAATLLSGKITLVNSAYGMVKIEYMDSTGATVEKQVFIKNTAKIIDSADPDVKSISDLKVGMNIAVTGNENLGIYEATTVMVLVAEAE